MLSVEKEANVMTLRPEGKITAANAEAFREQLRETLANNDKDVVIDLAKVDIIDSKGLALFIVCHKTLAEQGHALTVVTDNEDLKGLFTVMRLDERFEIRGSGR